jgi:hypothetical protein
MRMAELHSRHLVDEHFLHVVGLMVSARSRPISSCIDGGQWVSGLQFASTDAGRRHENDPA